MDNMDLLTNEILRLRVLIEKETNKDVKKILIMQKKYLEQVRKDVGSIYLKYGDDEGNLIINSVDRYSIMRNMERNIVNMNRELIKQTTKITDETLLKGYVNSYYKTAHIINNGTKAGINYRLLRPEFIESVLKANFEGMSYSDRIWRNNNKLANKLYDIIGKGITDGTSVQKLSKEIKNAFGVSSYEARRLVHTELARVVSEATLDIYEDSGVVDKVMYVATLDNLTSNICQERDSSIWELNDPNKPIIPAHPNCRSCWVSYLPEWQPKFRRDNITKENIPFQSYSDWARGQ